MTKQMTRAFVRAALLAAVFAAALGADVQCTEAEAERTSLSSLQAQIDALQSRVTELEQPASKRVFATSETFRGDLGGLDGGDSICNQAASNAGLDGLYRAWLGDSLEAPAERFTRSRDPYVLLDGTRIADNWDGLTDGVIQGPIDVDEFGQPLLEPTHVWTNVAFNGLRTGTEETDHCEGWTLSFDGRGTIKVEK